MYVPEDICVVVANTPWQVSGRIMLDYGTHKQAAPQLATNLSTSGAATEKVYKFSGVAKIDSKNDISMARKASDKENRFMSHLNTPPLRNLR